MNVKRVQLIAAILTSGAVVLAVAAQVQSAAAWRKAASADRLAINVLDSAPWPIIACTETMEVVVFNEAAATFTGWPSKAMLGGPLERIVPAEYMVGHGEAFNRAAAKLADSQQDWTAPRDIAAAVLCADGRIEPCTISVRGVRSGTDRLFIANILPDSLGATAAQQLRAGQADRWTGEDMREWVKALEESNPDLEVPKTE